MKEGCQAAQTAQRFGPGVGLIVLGAVFFLIPIGAAHGGNAEPVSSCAPRFRQPVALSINRDGNRLVVANRRSGSLSVVDIPRAQVVAEHDLGRGLADVAAFADGVHILVVDQAANSLLLLETRDRSIRVLEKKELSPDPVTVLLAPDDRWCVVASRWSRRLSVFEISTPTDGSPRALTAGRTIDLPFSPRNMTFAEADAKLVVGDAFGGKLAVVDVKRGAVDSVRSLPAQNIRGLAMTPDGKTLVVAHQLLQRLAHSSFVDVHWGSLINSHVRSLRMDAVLNAKSDGDLLQGSATVNLGFPEDGAGDPAAMVIDRSGGVVVALGGVDDVAFGQSSTGHFRRIDVGHRPAALALKADGKSVYVADAFSDTVSVVDLVAGHRLKTITLGPRPKEGLVDRGERLFYDARMSHDGWMSCHSCHTDGHTNGQVADTLGDNSFGAPKRVPTLLGTADTAPWAWNGSVARLEDQVRKSIETTMRNPTPSEDQIEALTAYVRTLTPPRLRPEDDQDEAVARGQEVFLAQKCAKCHALPAYTTSGRYDVGLDDELGNRKFNPPALRGVGLREPLLHDGRAKTLADVFDVHKHPRDTYLTPEQISDLVAYLKTL